MLEFNPFVEDPQINENKEYAKKIEGRFGLIGEKLGHSFSKVIHNELCNYDYDLMPVAKDDFDAFMQERAFDGINVTIPYKEAVIPYLSHIDKHAEAIGAVNTIVNKNGELYGYNTDFYGVEYMLKQHDISLADKTVMILGTGGTCKTIEAVCKANNAAKILKVSRSGAPNLTYAEAAKTSANVVLNASPRGMYPDNYAESFDLSGISGLEAVVDVIYNPLHTDLIVQAKKLGLKACGGLVMLVAQAKAAAEYFIGEDIPDYCIGEIYQQLLQTQQNIVMVGMPGSGKTTIGKLLAEKLGKTFVDTDDVIIENAGISIPEIFQNEGEIGFRKHEQEALKAVAAKHGQIIATGGGAVKNPANVDILHQNGVIVLLERDLEKLPVDPNRPLSSGREALQKMFEERRPSYLAAADHIVDNNGSAEAAVEAIFEYLQNGGK